ncbi:MAG: LacI family transcriptional regulator [Naasia sp.]|jgi:LacI family transcriptional regulator|uniref:LacI family DNA-binding transcriptional regulator n=1 Tax=Naasia sp. TaxID=2546198 RepID=UPI00261FC467|nr:LacI family DNA-binding transcriptional regulator [Naasia sp.]MCU1571358.1 LacI family transcriptional regulator [Naasia sp.]
MATIYEVAALAGVSPATVSRVLNGTRVAEDLAGRVRAAAEELDFTPSRTARSLRRRHSELIALVIPDIENPFFTALARGVEDTARAAGYSVVLCNTDEDTDRESTYLRIAAAEQMAGVILAPAGETSDLGSLAGRPVVAVDRSPHGHDIDTVTADSIGAGRAATAALLERGRTRIACITGPAGVDTSEDRAQGWRDAIEAATGRTPDPSLLRHADFRFDGGREEAGRLLRSLPRVDGIVVTNNLMGAGALAAVTAAPGSLSAEGIAIIGDLPYSALVPAGVAIVSLPARELGEEAARLLLARIGGDASPPRRVVLDGVASSLRAPIPG